LDKQTFNDILSEFEEQEHKLLGVKRSEYAKDEDCLVNFKEVSAIVGLDPEEYCLILAMKHIHAIKRAVFSDQAIKWSWQDPVFGEGLKQRIADARNFLILLAAILEEDFSSPPLQPDPGAGTVVIDSDGTD
jgi:hypothetical protein